MRNKPNDLCVFTAKFRDGETTNDFMRSLQTFAENNAQLTQ